MFFMFTSHMMIMFKIIIDFLRLFSNVQFSNIYKSFPSSFNHAPIILKIFFLAINDIMTSSDGVK